MGKKVDFNSLCNFLEGADFAAFIEDIHRKRIVFANSSLAALTGFKNAELTGNSPSRIFSYAQKPLAHMDGNHSLNIFIKNKDHSSHYLIHFVPVTIDGSKFRVNIVCSSVPDQEKIDEINELKKNIELILGATKTGLILLDSKFNIIYADPFSVQDRGNFKGRKCYEYLTGKVIPCERCGMKQANCTKNPSVIEEVFKSGTIKQVSTIPFRNKDGRTLFAQISVDVSNQKRIENELEKKTELYEALFNNMSSGAAIYSSPDHGKTFVFKDFNKAGEKIDQIKKDDLVGKSITHIFPGVKKLGLLKAIKNVYTTGRPENIPLSFYSDNRISGWRDNYIYKLPSGEVATVYDDKTREKKMEFALKESENRLSGIMDRVSDMIMLLDRQGRLYYISPSVQSTLGYTPEMLIGKRYSNLITSHNHDFSNKKIHNHKKENFGPVEVKIRCKNGGTSIFHSFNIPIIEHGSHVGTQLILRDITQIRKAENELTFKNALLEGQSETSLDGILVVNEKGMIVSKNTHFDELWRVPKSLRNIKNDRLTLGFVSRQLKRRNEFLKKVKFLYKHKNEKSFDTLELKDGRTFERYSSPLFDKNQNYYGRVWYFRDVSERKASEINLIESRKALSQFIDSAPGFIQSFLPNGKFSFVNKKWKEAFGYTDDELAKLTIWDLIHKSQIPHCKAIFQKVMAGKKIDNFKTIFVSKSGRMVYLSGNVAPIVVNGRVTSTDGVFVDVTEQKKAENGIIARNIELEKFSKITIGRELKMIELKKEINSLLSDMGKAPKYKLD